jgi:hypothetical protein
VSAIKILILAKCNACISKDIQKGDRLPIVSAFSRVKRQMELTGMFKRKYGGREAAPARGG